MKSNLIAAAVLAVSTLASAGASAQVFNSWAFDQAQTPSTKTRAEVKAEAVQANNQNQNQNQNQAVQTSYGALTQPAPAVAEKTAAEARSASLLKTEGQ